MDGKRNYHSMLCNKQPPMPTPSGTGLQQRLEKVGPEIRDIAWRAQLRLCGRFRKLAARGLHKNKAVVAIARELTGFV